MLTGAPRTRLEEDPLASGRIFFNSPRVGLHPWAVALPEHPPANTRFIVNSPNFIKLWYQSTFNSKWRCGCNSFNQLVFRYCRKNLLLRGLCYYLACALHGRAECSSAFPGGGAIPWQGAFGVRGGGGVIRGAAGDDGGQEDEEANFEQFGKRCHRRVGC